MTRFPKAPELIVYDNCCNLAAYCLNNEPLFFRNTKFSIDAFHYHHHTNCNSSFNSLHITARDPALQASLTEQKNLRFAVLKATFAKMHPRNSLPMLYYLATRLNRYEWAHFVSYGSKKFPLVNLLGKRYKADSAQVSQLHGNTRAEGVTLQEYNEMQKKGEFNETSEDEDAPEDAVVSEEAWVDDSIFS